MEATNRFKGLDLIERVPEELWTEVRDIKEVIKMIPKRKKCKAKWRPFKQLKKEEMQKAKEIGKDIPN